MKFEVLHKVLSTLKIFITVIFQKNSDIFGQTNALAKYLANATFSQNQKLQLGKDPLYFFGWNMLILCAQAYA